jgi:hypothetical protein
MFLRGTKDVTSPSDKVAVSRDVPMLAHKENTAPIQRDLVNGPSFQEFSSSVVFQAKNSIPEIKRSKVTDEKLKAEREKRERTYDQRI